MSILFHVWGAHATRVLISATSPKCLIIHRPLWRQHSFEIVGESPTITRGSRALPI